MRQHEAAKIDHWLILARSLGDVATPVVSTLSALAPFEDGVASAAAAARFVTGIVPAPLKPVAQALTLDLQEVVRSTSRPRGSDNSSWSAAGEPYPELTCAALSALLRTCLAGAAPLQVLQSHSTDPCGSHPGSKEERLLS
jgi:hypothetical protein